MRTALRLVAPLSLAALVSLVPQSASAVVRAQSDYPYDQVWNAAVRLVRVDLGFEIMERDQEGGFVLFKYRGDSGTFNASLEVVRPAQGGKVGLVIQVPEMPRYTELWLLDRLNRKMHDDYGAPPRPVPRPAASPTGTNGRNGDGSGDGRGGGQNGARGRGGSGSGSASNDRRSSSDR